MKKFVALHRWDTTVYEILKEENGISTLRVVKHDVLGDVRSLTAMLVNGTISSNLNKEVQRPNWLQPNEMVTHWGKEYFLTSEGFLSDLPNIEELLV